jgi:TolB-like protein/Tfp pilus assembly protein PilF
MLSTRSELGCVEIGDCRLDNPRGLLLRDGQPVALRAKSYALLSFMATHAGQVLAKDQLLSAVWPDVLVTEDSLTQAVREIRKALHDERQHIVRTIPRRGYLLDISTPVTSADTGAPRVAVLRFANLGSADDEALVDGFAEDLIGRLALFRRLPVLARNSSFAFASGADPDIAEIGRRLDAAYLVCGSAQRNGNMLRVRVTLVDPASGAILWGDSFAAAGEDVFATQDDIAAKVINRLVARLDEAGVGRASLRAPASLDAHDLLLRGLVRLRGYGETDNEEAKALFEAALDKDSGYALAHAYLALTDLAIAGYGEAPAAVIEDVLRRAAFAVSLSPEDPRCLRVLSMARLHAREHAAAEYHLVRSLDLNPYDADTMSHMSYLQTMRGRPLVALHWLDRAMRINPIHPDWYNYDRAIALYSAGQYRGAIDCLETLSLTTPWRLARLAACHAQLGEMDRARALVAQIRQADPTYDILHFARCGLVFEHPSDVDHLVDGVAKAIAA